MQVFVGYDLPRNTIVVSFRGSKTLANWINDMRFAHVDTPFPECSGCFLHKGFITSCSPPLLLLLLLLWIGFDGGAGTTALRCLCSLQSASCAHSNTPYP